MSLDEGGQRLIVRRDVAGILIEPIDAGEFAWLSAIHGGAHLAFAIEAAQEVDAKFDLGAALHRNIGAGTIVAALLDE